MRHSRIVYELGNITRYDVSDTDDSAENIARGHFNTPRREEYDAHGRLFAVHEINTGGIELTTRYTLDPLGQLLTINDRAGIEVANYTYDLLQRKILVDHVDAGRRRVVYDARGDLAHRIDALDQVTTLHYDEIRRIIHTVSDGVVVERYTYDTGMGNNMIGRLAHVIDEAGEMRFSYTARGLIESKTRIVDSLNGPESLVLIYTYDSMEQMTNVIYPNGTSVRYTYDKRGLLSNVAGFVDMISWNTFGQVEKIRLSNGVTESYTFDPNTFYLVESKVSGPTQPDPYYHVTYSHDAVGNPVSITHHVEPQATVVIQETTLMTPCTN